METTRNHGPKSLRSHNFAAATMGKIHRFAATRATDVATNTKTSKTAGTDGAHLTEEQILAMGEKDYMNPAQLAFFKARLQQLEKDLLKNAGETTEHLRETVLVPDPADRATIEEEHALELRTRDSAVASTSDCHPFSGSPTAARAQAKALRRLIRRQHDAPGCCEPGNSLQP
jgi:DnaK suppressor protein